MKKEFENVLTIIELLEYRSKEYGNKIAYRFLNDKGIEEEKITYAELLKRAKLFSSEISKSINPGERALLVFPSGIAFVESFLGCLMAGIIAIPINPPTSKRHIARVNSIVKDSGSNCLISVSSLFDKITKWSSYTLLDENLKIFLYEDVKKTGSEKSPIKTIVPEGLAFLQYTSGSTADPKGVMISHNNIIHNAKLVSSFLKLSDKTIHVSWLPIFHDMGLIGCIISTIYCGGTLVFMAPTTFIKKPVKWLKTISKFKGTVTGAPNFAFDLCTENIRLNDLKGIDLSSCKIFFNGSEPIKEASMVDFVSKFSHVGMKLNFFKPCYGMAETTLVVSGYDKDLPEIIDWPIDSTLQKTNSLVCLGPVLEDLEIKIVCPINLKELNLGEEGEVWISGPSVGMGYWNRPEDSTEIFDAFCQDLNGELNGPFLRTGDIGILKRKQLFICGRLKEMMIFNGRNYFPQDIEAHLQNTSEYFSLNNGAAFSIEIEGLEKLVIMQEIKRSYMRDCNSSALMKSVYNEVYQEFELPIFDILFLKPASIPKTSSGKIQRRACRKAYLEGDFSSVLNRYLDLKAESFQNDDNEISRRNELFQWLTRKISDILHKPLKYVKPNSSFSELGMTSIQGIQLASHLSSYLKKEINPVVLYDYSTLKDLVDKISLSGEDKKNNEEVQIDGKEAIAIIGVSCRFPEADNIQSFWDNLKKGVNSVKKASQFPDAIKRFNFENHELDEPYTYGGYIDNIEKFDASFFNISPPEAKLMDPQQRILLELSYEAIESAGLLREQLKGSQTGVYIGLSHSDYWDTINNSGSGVGLFASIGNSLSIAANRISYFYDLKGPSMAIDTACSSSLTAIHLAVKDIQNGNCTTAIAGGINLIISPEVSKSLAKANFLSRDGICSAFDAKANGYVRGEGGGLVILKPLSKARLNGDKVLGIIRGTAIAQDGKSNGLTAPSGLSQQSLISEALMNAGLLPSQISYVEAHGTGTELGDPIEIMALSKIYGLDRLKISPLLVGSVKAHIGHLESAAGIAGLIKVLCCFEHKQIPKQINYETPNPFIDWDQLNLAIVDSHKKWEKLNDQPRRAGVSSFGFGGAIAHLILEEPPAQMIDIQSKNDDYLLNDFLVVSGPNENTTRNISENIFDYLQNNKDVSLSQVAYTLATTREHFDYRQFFILKPNVISRDFLNADSFRLFRTNLFLKEKKTALLFTGQGSQYIGMGAELYANEPVYQKAFNKCCKLFMVHLDQNLIDILFPTNLTDSSLINETQYTQPLIFSLGYALYELWTSWGIKPTIVMGHSIGEITAACVAGVLTLNHAVLLVSVRGKLMQSLPKGGSMVVAHTSISKLNEIFGKELNDISVAAINSDREITLSGSHKELQKLCIKLKGLGIKSNQLKVSHAFHSSFMNPILETFVDAISEVKYHNPRIPIVSTVTGKLAKPNLFNAAYWGKHIRETVRFSSAIESLSELQIDTFLEIGANPTLTISAMYSADDGKPKLFLHSLRKGKNDLLVMKENLAKWYVEGGTVDWKSLYKNRETSKIYIPHYYFSKDSYWVKKVKSELSINLCEPNKEHLLLDSLAKGDQTTLENLFTALEGHLSEDAKKALSELLKVLVSDSKIKQNHRDISKMLYQSKWENIESNDLKSSTQCLKDEVWLVLVDDTELSKIFIDEIERKKIEFIRFNINDLGTANLCDESSEIEIINKKVLGFFNLGDKKTIKRITIFWGNDIPTQVTHVGEIYKQIQTYIFRIVQTLIAVTKTIKGDSLPTFFVTHGATSVDVNDLLFRPIMNMIHGLSKTFFLEYPNLRGGIIDLTEIFSVPEISQLVSAIFSNGKEDLLALRKGKVFANRIERFKINASSTKPWKTSGSGIIVGGLGFLGLKMAAWLATKGIQKIFLFSRSGSISKQAIEVIQEIKGLGVQIKVVKIDITQFEKLSAVISKINNLRVVIHAAGYIEPQLLVKFCQKSMGKHLDTKFHGLKNLEKLTLKPNLDAFVNCSSISSVWGAASLGAYAAVNAFLDAWNREQRQKGFSSYVINWGPWEGGGMANLDSKKDLRKLGINELSSEFGIDALEFILSNDIDEIIVADINWKVFKPIFQSVGQSELYSKIDSDRIEGSVSKEKTPFTLLVLSQPINLREIMILDWLQKTVADLLNEVNPLNIDKKIGLAEQGVSSLLAVELTHIISVEFGIIISVPKVVTISNLTELSLYVLEQILEQDVEEERPLQRPHVNRQDKYERDIAIVGTSFRLPNGVNDMDALWKLLKNETDVTSDIPTDRFDVNLHYDPNPEVKDKMYTSKGTFISGHDMFDAKFFGLSPREVIKMDPLQRFLLECSWEALENSGITKEGTSNQKVGVFIGAGSSDYGNLQKNIADKDVYDITGSQQAFLSGRISYLLGINGPSISIDTACSSSLVALHLACQSLRNGESDIALVGGAQLLLSPDPFIALSKGKSLAPDGKSKSFSSTADGYGRGEGCVVMVLRRLNGVNPERDNILGIIRGSAINHDGASSGLTVPNGLAQESVIQDALKDAKVAATEVSYVEAHGTGTKIGDPIEVEALQSVYGKRKTNGPLYIGSIKSNIGHLEAVSGLAGMLKVLVSFQHNTLPKSLHSEHLNEHIPWNENNVQVLQKARSWKNNGLSNLAGLSSFGLSGTNAHIIIESPPLKDETSYLKKKLEVSEQNLLVFSAKSVEELKALLSNMSHYISENEDVLIDEITYNLAVKRNHFKNRYSIFATNKKDVKRLIEYGISEISDQNTVMERSKLAFLFTGSWHGAHYVGMAKQLYITNAVFKNVIDKCDSLIFSIAGFSLHDILFHEDAHLLNQIQYAQAAIFAVGYGVFKIWENWGITPDFLLGHDLGEITAACAAGVFNLENGLKLVVARGRILQKSSQDCKMASIQMNNIDAEELIAPYKNKIALAAINGPDQIVISGYSGNIDEICEILDKRDIKNKKLEIHQASHSPLLDSYLDEFRDSVLEIQFQSPKYALISSLSGKLAEEEILLIEYWVNHLREAVQFEKGILQLESFGVNTFLEIGPDPKLSNMGSNINSKLNNELWLSSAWLFSLKKDYNDNEMMLRNLGKLYNRGHDINWQGVFSGKETRFLQMPNYPFQRKRYWFKEKSIENKPNNYHINLKDIPISLTTDRLLMNNIEIKNILKRIIGKALYMEVNNIPEEESLLELGADSLILMEIIKNIQIEFGLSIDISNLFEELSDIKSLVDFISKESQSLNVADGNTLSSNSQILSDKSIPYCTNSLISTKEGKGDLSVLLAQMDAQNKLMMEQFRLQNEILSNYIGENIRTVTPLDNSFSLSGIKPDANEQNQSKQKKIVKPFEGIKETHKVKISENRREHLNHLLSTYNNKTKNSKKITQQYREVLADNRASSGFRLSTKELLYPVISNKSSGSKIWDVDGNEYIDLTMGFGSCIFGHQQDFILDALKDRLSQGIHIGPQSHLAGEVASLITEITGFDRVCFANTGTEAVMVALRLARAATKKDKVVVFEGSYHGHLDSVLGVPGASVLETDPVTVGISKNAVKDLIVLEFNSEESIKIIDQISDQIAAVLISPVRSRFPGVLPKKEWLMGIREVTKTKNIAMIFDEIITGFRILPGGAQEYFDIRVDIATYGKIAGGGMPLGIVAGNKNFLDVVDGGAWQYNDDSYPSTVPTFLAGTFTKHPLALAASKAVLTKIKNMGNHKYLALNERTQNLVSRLNFFFKKHKLQIEVVSFGSQFKFNFSRNLDLFFYDLLNEGVYIWEGRVCYLSFAHTDEDIEKLYVAITKCILRQEEIIERPHKVSKTPKVTDYPVSLFQKAIWVEKELNPDSTVYNMISAHSLEGHLNWEILVETVNTIIRRHESLRTVFLMREGELRQRIILEEEFDYDKVFRNNSIDNKHDSSTDLDLWIENEISYSFDLEFGPLIRFSCTPLEKTNTLLIINMHHIISDGWSLGVILNEFIQLYRSNCNGELVSLPELKIQFKDYIKWQNSYLESEKAEKDRMFWKEQLSGELPVLQLNADFQRPEVITHQGKTKKWNVKKDLFEKLQAYSKDRQATLFIILTAITKVLFYSRSGQTEILLGTPVANRNFPELFNQIGCYLNTIVLRNSFSDETIFEDFLKQVKTNTLKAYSHRDFPYEILVSEFLNHRELGRNPFYDALVVLDTLGNQIDSSGEVISKVTSSEIVIEKNLRFKPFEFETGTSKVDITLFFTIGETFQCNIEYRTDLFSEKTVDEMIYSFDQIMELVITNSKLTLKEIKRMISTQDNNDGIDHKNSSSFEKLDEEF